VYDVTIQFPQSVSESAFKAMREEMKAVDGIGETISMTAKSGHAQKPTLWVPGGTVASLEEAIRMIQRQGIPGVVIFGPDGASYTLQLNRDPAGEIGRFFLRTTEPSKLKILFLASDPSDAAKLALGKELREITAQVRSAKYREAIELTSHWAVRPGDLQQALIDHNPQIVHFSGHGTLSGKAGREEAQIILETDDGRAQPVSTDGLVGLFDKLKGQVRVVLFNACCTEALATALVRTIDCSIGMRGEITDVAALAFSAAFYRAIANGLDVGTAFGLGINELTLRGIPEAETPVKKHRRGAPDAGHLSLLNPGGPPSSIKA
jgi:hypothetical protein